MRLHHHPISTTSRAVTFFAADHGLALEHRQVDLFTGEHLQPAYAVLNPSQCVPVLEDGAFCLTESSAILKYLADAHGLDSAYPRDPRARARVNEQMDWLNTFLSRELCYGFVYPQVFPQHRRPDAAVQAATLAWARPQARRWLGVLDEHLIGPHQNHLGGALPSLADYLGIAMLTLGEAVHADYRRWRNLSRWIAAMKARPAFAPTHAAFYAQLVAPGAGATFEAL
ncbi:glutathione S-transferase family protein [Ideonella sp.]|uniref:glutathione S-transferase family protein n=1 Tax=Ideonella sp. TaxID=1929293 RepID=UPI002B48A1A2|nr:glutathione S-transferase family protein [Ideonella sp.]HJV69947.1 glutathione S-transferase family protein [Ideonella sp.]